MQTGLAIFNGVSLETMVKCFQKNGIKHTFIMSDHPEFDRAMQLFGENGIVCDNLHAPYKGINAMWGEDEAAANAMLARLTDSVDKCAKYGIPATVVHLSSGRPMPEINEKGLQRYETLFRYAKEKGVTVALENLRYAENLAYFMEHYPECAFCWDNGHQYCYTPDVRHMKLYGHRLAVLHIHDNRCELDTDDHLLPFDGKIPFDQVAQDIAESGYRGTLMLEVGRVLKVDGKNPYAELSEEEFVDRAAAAVNKLNDMVERCREELEVRL